MSRPRHPSCSACVGCVGCCWRRSTKSTHPAHQRCAERVPLFRVEVVASLGDDDELALLDGVADDLDHRVEGQMKSDSPNMRSVGHATWRSTSEAAPRDSRWSRSATAGGVGTGGGSGGRPPGTGQRWKYKGRNPITSSFGFDAPARTRRHAADASGCATPFASAVASTADHYSSSMSKEVLMSTRPRTRRLLNNPVDGARVRGAGSSG